jgi:hypothetical protein
MSRKLQPALHDIGKLVDTRALPIGEHYFENIGWLVSQGIMLPATDTWKGIIGHHATPQDAEVFLLGLADHAASAASRAYDQEDKESIEHPVTTTETVHRLWRPDDRRSLKRLSDIERLQDLFDFLRSDPDDEAYLEKYAELLHQRPEDLRKPLDVASLYTHSRLVAKFYCLFKRHATVLKSTAPDLSLEFRGRKATNSPEDAEYNWQVWLTFGEVYFPQEPARARDLNVFNQLAMIMHCLAQQDEVLFCVSNQFLAILPSGGEDSDLRALLQPVLTEGFYAKIKQAKVFLKRDDPLEPSMYENPLPDVLRQRAIQAVEEQVQRWSAKIPEEIRLQKALERRRKLEANIEEQFPHKARYSSLPSGFGASICEICQMEEGTVDWPKQYVLDTVDLCEHCRPMVEESGWPPDTVALCPNCLRAVGNWLEGRTGREVLGKRCYALRREGVRLKKLAQWTDQPRERVAWVRVVLDVPRLIESLDTLYAKYVDKVAPELIEKYGKPDLRMSVVAEFQWDYEEFLRHFNAAVIEHFGQANVEQVFGQQTDAQVNDLLCVRLNRTRDLLCLLKLYQDLMWPFPGKFFCRHRAHTCYAKPFFPAFVDLPASPVQLLVTSSRAHYPFFQHWRQMERERGRSDVYLQVVGSGELRASLRALGPMLSKAEWRNRRAFHTLAEIARLSEALARLRMHDRGDRQQWIYRRLRDDLLPLGLDYQSILTLVKIIGG